MATERQTFGSYLRTLRLKAGYGLRTFALECGFQPSNLSRLERGKLAAPRDPDRLRQIAGALGIPEGTREWVRLFDLAARSLAAPLPADLAGYARKHRGIPVLLRAARAKRLTDKEFRELADHISKHL